jgi:hypothetical protein
MHVQTKRTVYYWTTGVYINIYLFISVHLKSVNVSVYLNKHTTLAAQLIKRVGSLASRLIHARHEMQVMGQFSATVNRRNLLSLPVSRSNRKDTTTPCNTDQVTVS